MSTLTKLLVAGLVVIVLILAVGAYMQATQPTPQPTLSPSPTIKPTQIPNPSFSPTPTSLESTPTPSSPTPSSPTPTPNLSEQEVIRNLVMNYIKSNHSETAQFMNNLVWTGGRATPENVVGAETYIYYSGGWNFTMTYPVVPQAIYKITADYKTTEVSIPYRVIWQGTWQNQIIKETDYVFAQ
jgi:hypothetical protein